ncbi:MAG: methionyl-tRNA formyltransferase [Candidatus Tectomicrobia bacterium]|uniref:Methionyl-tRNA formyltransferase n=1 Tax=Tectimicrobiota bacterium TaxID=2528274 RepID=A0A933LPZ8_UNCTE|nr:methionyl-tRNA formyltransferase [Candidatus Tectomicrobia bacterium]
MRIVFMGTPYFAVPILERLVRSEHEVVGVVTQRDKPKGRGQKILPPPVKEFALHEKIAVFQPTKARDPEFIEVLRSLKFEAIVVAAYGQILPKDILDIPSLGCINVHASLLPRFRGAAPINWTIIRGEEKTGITAILMDEGMDTGPILLQREIEVHPDETAESLTGRLASLGGEVLLESLTGWQHGMISPKPQHHEGATYAPKLKKEDGKINWSQSALEISRVVRGLEPWPCAYTETNKGLLKIWKAQVIGRDESKLPGEVAEIEDDIVYVSTGSGLLAVKEVQLESRRRMSVKEFLQGHAVVKGEQWGD